MLYDNHALTVSGLSCNGQRRKRATDTQTQTSEIVVDSSLTTDQVIVYLNHGIS